MARHEDDRAPDPPCLWVELDLLEEQHALLVRQTDADEVGALWAGFARNSSVPPQWPAYYETSDADAVIDEGGADGSGIKMTETGRHDAACELWDQRAQELWPQAKRE